MSDRHARSSADVLAELGSGPQGLEAAEAGRRLVRNGPNRLPEAAGPSPLRLLFDQVRTPLIGALIGCGVLAVAIGELEDGAVVLGVVALNALIGFAQGDRVAADLRLLGIAIVLGLQVLFVFAPFMQAVFGSAPISVRELVWALVAAVVVLPVVGVEERWRAGGRAVAQS